MVVFDGRGETLNSFFADRAGVSCQRGAEKTFGPALVKMIVASLRRRTSLEARERRWRADPANLAKLCRWLDTLMVFQRDGMLRRLHEQPDRAWPRRVRETFALYAYGAFHEYHCGGPKLQLGVETGEDLLIRLPDHPRARLLRHYLHYYLICGFDVRARWEHCRARLLAQAGKSPDSAALRRQVRMLGRMVSQTLTRIAAYAKKEGKSVHSAGLLGDAETVVRLLTAPGNKHREEKVWLEEARRKLLNAPSDCKRRSSL